MSLFCKLIFGLVAVLSAEATEKCANGGTVAACTTNCYYRLQGTELKAWCKSAGGNPLKVKQSCKGTAPPGDGDGSAPTGGGRSGSGSGEGDSTRFRRDEACFECYMAVDTTTSAVVVGPGKSLPSQCKPSGGGGGGGAAIAQSTFWLSLSSIPVMLIMI